MTRQELISPEGLRQDGRRPAELRAFSGDMGVLLDVDGSGLFELGGTRVVAGVVGPREALDRTFVAADRGALISVSIHAAAFSSTGGGGSRGHGDRRLLEWARLVEAALSACVLADSFPRSVVDVFVEILNADGSVLAAIVNAVNLALMDAGIPMRDYVTAVTVMTGAQNVLVMDPNRMEETSFGVQPSATVAFLPRTKQVVMTSVEPKMGGDKLAKVMSLAEMGASKVFECIDADTVRPRLAYLHHQRTTPIDDNKWQ